MISPRFGETAYSTHLQPEPVVRVKVILRKMSFGRENRHDAINIDDSSSMQDTCHMNFVIGHTQHRVSVAQCLSIRAQNLKVRGLIPNEDSIFFLFLLLVS